jgi:hypothetical protein
MSTETFVCSCCQQEKPVNKEGGTGYATDAHGNKTCYECCGKQDEKELASMQPGEKTVMYWDGKQITNWPGTLKISPYRTTSAPHNIGGRKTNIWFTFAGNHFYAYQIGNNSQIAHIRRIKN